MIGFGLSLCGACVMADADTGSSKPMYDATATRGYFISAKTKIPSVATGTARFFVKTIEGREPDIEQRAVCFSAQMAENTPSVTPFYYMRYGSYDFRDVFAVNDAQRAGICFKRIFDESQILSLPHFGLMDCRHRNRVASASVALDDDTVTGSFTVGESGGVATFQTAHFIGRSSGLAPDACFMMGYTKNLGAYVQLVYPLAEITGAAVIAAINVVDKSIVEI